MSTSSCYLFCTYFPYKGMDSDANLQMILRQTEKLIHQRACETMKNESVKIKIAHLFLMNHSLFISPDKDTSFRPMIFLKNNHTECKLKLMCWE